MNWFPDWVINLPYKKNEFQLAYPPHKIYLPNEPVPTGPGPKSGKYTYPTIELLATMVGMPHKFPMNLFKVESNNTSPLQMGTQPNLLIL